MDEDNVPELTVDLYVEDEEEQERDEVVDDEVEIDYVHLNIM